MDREELVSFSLSEFCTNAYLLIDKERGEAILIDAPGGIDKVLQFVDEKKLNLKGVIVTHGHIDHIAGLAKIDLPFYIHEKDREFLINPGLNLSSFFGRPVSISKKPVILKEGDAHIGSFYIEVLHTPGHTPGSVSFLVDGCLFSGDALFYGSIGRTDIPLASYEVLIESIKRKILPCGDDVRVYPGHGPSTTIKRESDLNPFLR